MESQTMQGTGVSTKKVRVGWWHILLGRRFQSKSCPIALALNKQLGGGRWYVTRNRLTREVSGYITVLPMPKSVKAWYEKFDETPFWRRYKLRPQTFEVLAP